jgi:pimeloyl-ACP methyl ester carboxylesterase
MTEFLNRDGETIAYLRRGGKSPGVMWLGGFNSDMAGTKAEALDAWARDRGRAYTRFDYFGHGRSSGEFRKGTISRWRDDALAVLDELNQGPQVLVGSSMGAWIALLAARLRQNRLHSLLLIAPAPDFTEDLMWAEMSWEIRNEIMEKGEWQRPSAYGETPYPITRALIEDGRNNLVLRAPIALDCPVRIVQGMKDPDVPWQHAMRLIDLIPGDVSITLIKNGDHRLSTPSDLKRITETLDGLVTP